MNTGEEGPAMFLALDGGVAFYQNLHLENRGYSLSGEKDGRIGHYGEG